MIRQGLTISGVCAAVAAALSAWAWTQLPAGAQMPVHFDALGRPDGWGPKWLGLGLMPAIILGLGLFLAAVSAMDPRAANLRRAPHLMLTGWAGGSVLLLLIHGVAVWTALGAADAPAPNMARIATIFMSLLFAALGNVMGKTRPNHVAGVRTAWTLSSDWTWEKTHRFAGRLTVAAGLLAALWAALAPLALALPGFLAAVLGAALASVAYSYFAWRVAPDRKR